MFVIELPAVAVIVMTCLPAGVPVEDSYVSQSA
jgi:hypothetical protein